MKNFLRRAAGLLCALASSASVSTAFALFAPGLPAVGETTTVPNGRVITPVGGWQ